MPETRKFEPAEPDPVEAAIRAALRKTAPPPEPEPTSAPVISTLGTYTFTTMPKPAVDGEDEEPTRSNPSHR